MSDQKAHRRPNVVIILADEMGYGDLSAYGNPLVETKNFGDRSLPPQAWTTISQANASIGGGG